MSRRVALAACLGALVAWCWLPAAGGPGGGRVVIGVRADVTSFNIYTATSAFTQEVIDLLYLRLAEEQDDFRDGPPSCRPALAASWEFSPDRLTLTFHLDPRARWGDGEAVTAADVVFSQRAAASAEVAWVGADVKEQIAEVTAPDPRTVVFRFTQPYPYQLLDAVEGNVLRAAAFSSLPFASWPKHAFLDAPAPDGPFKLTRYEPGAVIELGRNPGYIHAPLPHLDSVAFRVLPDEATLLQELLSGGIDVKAKEPPQEAARVEASPRLRLVRVPDLAYGFICWNLARPPFSDPRVRRALTLAIDREAIVEGLLQGTGRVTAGPILSFLWAHDPDLKPLPYDPPAARGLLREAGWEDRDGDGIVDKDGRPFRFELESNQGSTLRADIAQMVAAQLRKVGVEAVPRVLEFGAFLERHERHEFDAFVSSYRESTKIDLKSAFHSASADGGYNYGRYSNPELDAVIDSARRETDPLAGRDLWRRAQRLIAADQPYTFLFERDRLDAFPRRLEGVRPSPRTAYAGLDEWRWAPADPPGP